MATLSDLTAEYQIWTAGNGYPEAGSADELLCNVWTDCHHHENEAAAIRVKAHWLQDFITRWEATQEAEDLAARDFRLWAAARVWCADFTVAGLSYADDDGVDRTTGYAYPMGCYIKDHEPEAGLYWTIADRGDVIGTLAECEAFLWNNHAKHEMAHA